MIWSVTCTLARCFRNSCSSPCLENVMNWKWHWWPQCTYWMLATQWIRQPIQLVTLRVNSIHQTPIIIYLNTYAIHQTCPYHMSWCLSGVCVMVSSVPTTFQVASFRTLANHNFLVDLFIAASISPTSSLLLCNSFSHQSYALYHHHHQPWLYNPWWVLALSLIHI